MCGRLDKYFFSFHINSTSKIIPDSLMDAFFDSSTLEEQWATFNKFPLAELEKHIRWSLLRFRSLFTCFLWLLFFCHVFSDFSSVESQKGGRSSSQLKYATLKEEEMVNHFWDRLCYISQNVPIKDNFYISLFLRGDRGYNPLEKPHFCPPYLKEEAFHQLKVCYKNLL